MTPLIITARLVNGFVASDPWSPSIDGILAYAHVRRTIGHDEMVLQAGRRQDLKPVEGLPLKVVTHGDMWWYAASSPRYDANERDRKYFHKRFRDMHAAALLPDIKKVQVNAGPFKECRNYDTRIVTKGVWWVAIGDADAVASLLAGITHIGRGTARGMGEVREWAVTEGLPGNEVDALYDRPLPAGYAAELGLVGQTMPWGLVPPGRVSVVECVMPERA